FGVDSCVFGSVYTHVCIGEGIKGNRRGGLQGGGARCVSAIISRLIFV
ncbi:MAG: hypothetical protein FD143_2894, partial [Ignavibacteria bacterium]